MLRSRVTCIVMPVGNPIKTHCGPACGGECENHQEHVAWRDRLDAGSSQHPKQCERQRVQRVRQLDEVDVADEEGVSSHRLALTGARYLFTVHCSRFFRSIPSL